MKSTLAGLVALVLTVTGLVQQAEEKSVIKTEETPLIDQAAPAEMQEDGITEEPETIESQRLFVIPFDETEVDDCGCIEMQVEELKAQLDRFVEKRSDTATLKAVVARLQSSSEENKGFEPLTLRVLAMLIKANDETEDALMQIRDGMDMIEATPPVLSSKMPEEEEETEAAANPDEAI